MIEYLKRRPFLLCAVGCIIASVLGFYSRAALLCFLILSVIFLIAFLLKGRSALAFVSILVLVCCLSSILYSFRIEALKKYDNKTVDCEFVIEEITNKSADIYIAEVSVLMGPKDIKGERISVFLNYPIKETGVILKGELDLNAFDEERKISFYSRNVFLYANSRDLTVVGKAPLKGAIGNIRSYIRNKLFEHTSVSEASTLCALIFGDRSFFSDEFYSCVKGAGVSHVMVVSGMHLSILVAFFLFLFERVFYNRRFTAVIMVGVFLLLGALCLWSSSIRRAGFCYLVMAIGLMLKRDPTPENSLGAAITLILITTPLAVFNIALQLSALSTFGILSVALPINRYLTSRKIFPSPVAATLVFAVNVSLSAIILTLPVTIYVFGYISRWSLIANLLIDTAVSAALCIAVAALIAEPVLGGFAAPIFKVAEYLTAYINKVIIFFGSGPDAVIRLRSWLWIPAVILILLIFWGLLACKKRIDMIKLTEKQRKILEEGGKKLKWQ